MKDHKIKTALFEGWEFCGSLSRKCPIFMVTCIKDLIFMISCIEDLIFMVSCIKGLIKKNTYSLLMNISLVEKVMWLHEKKIKSITKEGLLRNFVYCAIFFYNSSLFLLNCMILRALKVNSNLCIMHTKQNNYHYFVTIIITKEVVLILLLYVANNIVSIIVFRAL